MVLLLNVTLESAQTTISSLRPNRNPGPDQESSESKQSTKELLYRARYASSTPTPTLAPARTRTRTPNPAPNP